MGCFGIASAMAVFVLAPSSVFADSQTWDGSDSNNWSTAANWVGNAVPGSTSVTNSADVATFNAAVANNQIVIDSGRNIGTILFDTGSVGSYTIGSTTGPALIISNAGAITMNSTVAAAQTINAPLTLNGTSGTALTITNNASSSNILTIGGNITSSSTSGNTSFTITGSNTGSNVITGNITNGSGTNVVRVTKQGGGTWFLSGGAGNTFTGGVTIQQGIISVASMLSLGSGTLKIANLSQGASFYYTGSGETTATVIDLNGTTGGANIYANNASGLLKFTSNFTATGAGSKTLSILGTGSGEIAGSIVDNGGVNITSVTKNNAGTWTLSGNNTYTGATTVTAGTLVFQNKATRTGGSLVTAAAAGTVGLGVGGGGGTDYSDTDVANLFNSTLSGFTLNSASGVAIDTTAGSFTLSTALTAARALTKLGNNTLTLSGANTYTGATIINAGTLSIAAITNGGVAGALGNSTNAAGNLTLGGGTLEYTGTVNGTTDRNFTLTAGTTSGISVANSTVSLTISGAAATSTGTLTKSGAGTLILSGANAYTGATTISAGTLQIGAGSTTGSISSSSSIINNGTTVSLHHIAAAALVPRPPTPGTQVAFYLISTFFHIYADRDTLRYIHLI